MRSVLLFLSIIVMFSSFTAGAQENEKAKTKIEGSGNVITKEVNVQSFDQIDVSGVFSLHLAQGGKEEVKIEADDNLQSLFEVKNEGSKLVISMKKDVNFNSKKKMKVYITFKKIKSMDLKTVGDVSGQSLSFDDLRFGNKSVGSVDLKLTAQSLAIDNKSVGDVTLSGKAENAVIKNKSVGSLNAGSFVVQTMDIDNNGVGSAEVNAEKELKVSDSFLGKVTNKGSATAKRTKKVTI
jgi:Putative auto-transporter adhesin, head GIN domain